MGEIIMTPATLRARIAASDGSDQDIILEEACMLLMPPPSDGILAKYEPWLANYRRFAELMTARAHESAALLIADAVLPGCGLSIEDNRSMPNGAFDTIVHPHDSFQGYSAKYDPIGRGCHRSCRALAIIDAVCAAVERKDETNG